MVIQHLPRELASKVMERCEALGKISDEPGRLTRTFASPAMRRANDMVGKWMRDAGLEVREDAIFNLIGRWPSKNSRAKTFLLGSHLDTVRDAGKYDGPLGVLVALACVDQLKRARVALPFHVEILGFSDEEGVRFGTTYLGSRVLAGTLRSRDLTRRDANAIALGESGIGDIKAARRKKTELIGYAEVHIEQGPVLESEHLALGLVSAISGQTRALVRFIGSAAHAGTTPMNLRKDAFCAAAEFVLAVESHARHGLVATVGAADVQPGASNVVPGQVTLPLDVRHRLDAARIDACRQLKKMSERIATSRKLQTKWTTLQENRSVDCSGGLTNLLRQSVAQVQRHGRMLPSGAGHDAAAMAAICPVAMLFVRCKRGISHHPDESVTESDVTRAIAALSDFLLRLKSQHE